MPGLSSRRRLAVLATVCSAVFAINLDTTIVNVALPDLTRQLGSSTRELQWVVDGYNLAFAALVLTGGSIGDRFGRRPALLIGLLGFAVASLIGASQHSSSGLIAVRFVMGGFAALIYPTTLSIISNTFTDRGDRAKAIGVWGAVTGLGVAVGPVTGGLLLAHLWWGSIFIALVPVALVAAALTAVVVPESRQPDSSRLDVPGLLTSSGAIGLLVFTIIEAPDHGWGSPRSLVGFVAAAALVISFVAIERRQASPMLDVGLFRIPAFAAASGAVTVAFFALFGFIFLITQYFQFVRGYGTLSTGTRILPVAGSIAVGSVAGTLLAAKLGTRVIVSSGLVIVPLAFSDAGQGTWLAYAFGTVMLSFVVMNLNQFSRRSASAGSMYAYTGRGLGPKGGVFSGWTLIWSYAFIAIAGLAGFSIFANQFIHSIGIHHNVPTVVLFAVSALLCAFVAYRDIRLSSVLTLVFEGVSVALILGLCFVVLFHHGFSVDTNQIKLKGVGLNDMNLAVVVCIFSLVGFESATALGGEAKDALRTVPRAVSWSLALTGLFFVVVSYVEVAGTQHLGTSLAGLSAPLNTLADVDHVTFFKAPISLGATVSFFSLSLSCINAGSRIMYPMARHGVFPHQIGSSHNQNQTPHVAIGVFTLAVFLIPAIMQGFTNPLTTFGDAGTLAAFGFLLAYFMISVAAPMFLRKRGELTRRNLVVSGLAIAFLLVPTVGSFYPVPPYPIRLFPYFFLAYMLVGAAWLGMVSRRNPAVFGEIEADLERVTEHQAPITGTQPAEIILPSAPEPASAVVSSAGF